MRKLLLSCIAIISLSIPSLSSAAQAPTSATLWHDVQALEKSHAIMLDSQPYQLGSRTVDIYTTDLANAAENDAVRKAGSIEKVKRYPNGALVVKENYDAQKKLTGVTAMLKLNGYDKADRDWVMAAYKPDGQVVAYGKIQACIACHAMVTQQDFVFAPPPEQLLPVSIWKAFFPKQQMSAQYVKLLDQHPEGIVK
ncbi:cytochrome P460 family protein [Acidithiobacillus sp.]|uniref:cytochrome P460 family protein n=1 Tax=Acidithiobacillus sp. TaxID=1872118 RepID=UPI00261A6C21|nr:cytochrome P460 family protein [Acidithiobacillus sp.]